MASLDNIYDVHEQLKKEKNLDFVILSMKHGKTRCKANFLFKIKNKKAIRHTILVLNSFIEELSKSL